MSDRSPPILDPENLTDQLARAVATLGTVTATKTARRAAAKTLHEALLAADSRASAKAILDTTSDLARFLGRSDPTIRSTFALTNMREHLLRTGDLVPRELPRPGKRPADPPADPSSTDDAAADIADNIQPPKKGLLGRLRRLAGWTH